MRLERHLRSFSKLAKQWNDLDVGANDVPLSAGLATGPIPEAAIPLDLNHRFGGNGDDAIPWWLKGERRIPNVSSFKAPPYAVIANRVKRHAGVALIGSFVAGPESQSRRFAVTTDVRLLPADKLKADSGSPFHGGDIRATGLPVAFATAPDAEYLNDSGGKLERGERVPSRAMIPLTGRVRLRGEKRLVETKDGHWIASDDVRTATKPSELPWFAKDGTKWMDVSILSQTLVLWEGATPVYATLVSTGKDGLGDPKTTHSTPTGTFRIYQKHVTTTMDSDMADHEFEAPRRPVGDVLQQRLRASRRVLARRLRACAVSRLRQPRAHRRALRVLLEHAFRSGALARCVCGRPVRWRHAGEHPRLSALARRARSAFAGNQHEHEGDTTALAMSATTDIVRGCAPSCSRAPSRRQMAGL